MTEEEYYNDEEVPESGTQLERTTEDGMTYMGDMSRYHKDQVF